MFYRFKQLYNAINPKIDEKEYKWLQSLLLPLELELFYRQALPEQRHALDVCYDLQKQKNAIESRFGTKQYQNLLMAALFHDCGKSLRPINLFQRIYIVILGHFPDQWQQALLKQQNFLGQTLFLWKEHPKWGKNLVFQVGMNKEIQAIIENHHEPQDPLAFLLYEADNRH